MLWLIFLKLPKSSNIPSPVVPVLPKEIKNEAANTINTRRFQANQAALEIENIPLNRGWWHNKHCVTISLSKLLHMEARQIDLKSIEWLPFYSTFYKVASHICDSHYSFNLVLDGSVPLLPKIVAKRIFLGSGLEPLFPLKRQLKTLITPSSRLLQIDSWLPSQVADKLVTTTPPKEKMKQQSSEHLQGLIEKELAALGSMTFCLEETLANLKRISNLPTREAMKEVSDNSSAAARLDSQPAHATDLRQSQETEDVFEPVGHPLNNNTSDNLSKEPEKELLMQLENKGDEVVEGALAIFKDLPYDEQQRTVKAWDRVRAELLRTL